MVLDLILDAFTDDSSTGARSCSTPHAADVVKFNVNLQDAPFDLDLITLPTRLSQRWTGEPVQHFDNSKRNSVPWCPPSSRRQPSSSGCFSALFSLVLGEKQRPMSRVGQFICTSTLVYLFFSKARMMMRVWISSATTPSSTRTLTVGVASALSWCKARRDDLHRSCGKSLCDGRLQLVSDRQLEEKRTPSRGPHRLDQAKSNLQMDFLLVQTTG